MTEDIRKNLRDLGENIEKRRKELGISRAELADRLEVSINSVSGYARGTQTPTFETLCKLATALETTLAELVGGKIENSQISNLIKKETEEAINKYRLSEAEEIFYTVGWDFVEKDGKIALVRIPQFEEIENFLNDWNSNIKYLTFDDNETLIALARTVVNTALHDFNQGSSMETLNNTLRKYAK